MEGVNVVVIVGTIKDNPALRGNNNNVLAFTVETSKSWRDKDTGETQTKTSLVKTVMFGPKCLNLHAQLSPGTIITFQGAIESNEYQGDDGQTRTGMQVVVRDLSIISKDSPQTGGSQEDDSDDPPF